MDEIVKRVANAVGIDEALAQKAVTIVFELVQEHGPKDAVADLMAKMPEMDVSAAPADSGGGLMGALGGLGDGLGGAMGAMGAMQKMTSAGLSMDQVQAVSKEVLAYAREHAGEERVGKVVGAIPGLSQFV
ncbi:hypothetical protein MNBD_ALPHA09-2319 [hydrothermal vent metagenome]|uniref:DUF2267 domain-containing protein n=1 Tax=hydrothermal vent metagenome TaxID=652676 RepID=A0A3B0TFX0_9ZZZZ